MRDIKFIYMYYIVLMIVTVVRTTETEPNAIIRIGYLLAFFMPIVLKYSELFSVCLVSFMTVGTYSFAYSFFPYQLVIYPIICLFTYIICKGDSPNRKRQDRPCRLPSEYILFIAFNNIFCTIKRWKCDI